MDFESVRDGERLSVGVKDAGAAEIFPQTLKHNSNGRFVVACGDGEYIIYTAMALRNKVITRIYSQFYCEYSVLYSLLETIVLYQVF